MEGRGNRTHLIAWPRRRGHLVLDLDCKGHLWLARHSGSHRTHRLVTAAVPRALLRGVLLLELSLLAVLSRLLDHAVKLLLCHADYGELAHLGVSDHSALLQELLLQSRKELLLPVISIVQVDQYRHDGWLRWHLLLLLLRILGRGRDTRTLAEVLVHLLLSTPHRAVMKTGCCGIVRGLKLSPA